jgi:hypothetical protein
MNRRTKKPPNREDIRNAVPALSPDVQKQEGQALTLRLPLQRKPGLLGWLARRASHPTNHELELDEIGAFVVGLCDGKRTLEGIALKLSNEYKITRHEAEASLLSFVDSLRKRGYLTLSRK